MLVITAHSQANINIYVDGVLRLRVCNTKNEPCSIGFDGDSGVKILREELGEPIRHTTSSRK